VERIAEWAFLKCEINRFAWGERYLYIKIVVIGVRLFCGKVVKALVRREKLSSISVDKGVESVDKLLENATYTTLLLSSITYIKLKPR
jgi:hypothetical protein